MAFLALVVRLLYFAEHARSAFFGVPILDEKYYDVIARAIVAGQGFSAVNPGFRPLLYPLFLAFSYRLGGDSGIALAVAAQHLLGVLTAVLVAALAMRLHRRASAGAAAGVLYALAGPPLFFEGELLITCLFSFLVIVLLWILSRAEVAPPSPVRQSALWLTAGLWLGLAAQARPNVLLFAVAFPAAALLWGRRRTPAALVARLLLPLAGAAVVLLAFAALQWKLAGHFQLLPSSGGINFYLGNKLGADGMVPRQDRSVTYGEEYRDSVEVFATTTYLRELERDGVALAAEPPSPGTISRYWLRRALDEIRRDPRRWLGLMGRKLLYLAWSYEIPNNKSFGFIREHESDVLKSLPVRWWLLLGLAAVGGAAAWPRDRKLTFWILAFLALHAAGIVLFFVNSRYRVPMWPALAVLAGGALPAVADALRVRQQRTLAVQAVTLAVVAALSLIGWAGVEPPGYSRDFFFRSLAELEKGDLAEARADAARSIEIDPEDPAAHFQLGNVALAAGDDLAAYESYLAAASRAPGEPRIFNNLGVVYERRGLPADAYRAYQVALSLAGDYGPALVNAALLELRAGLLERAEDKLERAAASGFDALPLTCARAFLAHERGREADARELLDTARRRDAKAAARLEQRQRQRLTPADLGVGPSARSGSGSPAPG